MSIYSLMLYGSCARGDNQIDSDIDMLALYSEKYYKTSVFNKVNVVYYNQDLLSERMKAGNLFCLHLVKEGKIIYDSNNTLASILSKFIYKNEYNEEIKDASELAWFLISYANEFNNYLVFNRKLSWCLRTIIIALSANKRLPVFSKTGMVNFVGDDTISAIINSKNSNKLFPDNLKIMSNFLNQRGYFKPEFLLKTKSISEATLCIPENSLIKYFVKKFSQKSYML